MNSLSAIIELNLPNTLLTSDTLVKYCLPIIEHPNQLRLARPVEHHQEFVSAELNPFLVARGIHGRLALPAVSRDGGLVAAAEIEELLKNTGAQSIERKTRDGQTILTARIRPENLEALREKLNSLGPVRENVQASPRPGAPLAIRLDIRSE